MFIETRFFDSGSAEARLGKGKPEPPEGVEFDKYDYYVDEVDGTLQDWLLENLEIETEDTFALITSLDAGGWVSITNYV